MASERTPAYSNSLPPAHTISSAQHAAMWILAALFGIGGSIVLLLGVVVAMFAETLAPHVVEFCLLAWQALSVHVAYRLMFLGLVVLSLAVLTFLLRMWWHVRLTEQYVKKLLFTQRALSGNLARIVNQLQLTSRVYVVAAPKPFALSCGWLKPHILVTTGLVEALDDQELYCVLAHEKYHLTQYDPIKILVARALRDAFLFIPVLKDLVENYLLLQEIAADQYALGHGATRELLASALLKVFRSPTWDALGVGAYSSFGERVQHLAQPHRKFNWRISSVRLLVSVAAVILLALAVLHPMAPMALGEALHADCHHVALLDIHSISLTPI